MSHSKRKRNNKWLQKQLASGKLIKQIDGTFIRNPDYKEPDGIKLDTKDKTINRGLGPFDANESQWGQFSRHNCVHYPTLVFKLGETDVYAATKDCLSQAGLKAHDISLVVNASLTSLNVANLVSGSKRFTDLNRYAYHIEEVHLNWDDGSSFAGDIDFWRALYKKLVEFEIKAVCFCCLGGHGRTGTSIAALVLSVTSEVADNIIDTIRDNYCKEAIETKTQEDYLLDLVTQRTKLYTFEQANVGLQVYVREKPLLSSLASVQVLPDMKGTDEPTEQAEDANKIIITELTNKAVDDIVKDLTRSAVDDTMAADIKEGYQWR